MADPLSIIESLEMQKYDKFYQLILAARKSDSNSVFCKSNDELFLHRHPSMRELQKTLILQRLRGRLYNSAHHHKLADHAGFTRRNATLQQTYSLPQMPANVIPSVSDCVQCAKIGFAY